MGTGLSGPSPNGNLGIPLPASTQWGVVHAQARHIEPVYAELLRQAAQGDVVHNDDTTIRILELMGKRAAALAPPIQTCDALSRNLPAELETIVANGAHVADVVMSLIYTCELCGANP